jgi:hypothetical protein
MKQSQEKIVFCSFLVGQRGVYKQIAKSLGFRDTPVID